MLYKTNQYWRKKGERNKTCHSIEFFSFCQKTQKKYWNECKKIYLRENKKISTCFSKLFLRFFLTKLNVENSIENEFSLLFCEWFEKLCCPFFGVLWNIPNHSFFFSFLPISSNFLIEQIRRFLFFPHFFLFSFRTK